MSQPEILDLLGKKTSFTELTRRYKQALLEAKLKPHVDTLLVEHYQRTITRYEGIIEDALTCLSSYVQAHHATQDSHTQHLETLMTLETTVSTLSKQLEAVVDNAELERDVLIKLSERLEA